MGEINGEIIYKHDSYFDKGDQNNASLYLGFSSQNSQPLLEDIVSLFRSNELWSAEAPAMIANEQKAAYAEQLDFVEALRCKTVDGNEFIASCFNHEKFPYNVDRWEQWKNLISENYVTTTIEA
jgi:hypothetical protein